PAIVVGGTEKDHASVAWAVDQFDQMGLALPSVVIAIHPDDEACEGFDGAFRRSAEPLRVDVCNRNRHIILHELAHVWDHHNLTDEVRQEFMDVLGLAGWNDPHLPWKERGVEALAEIVTWGMHDGAVTGDADAMLVRVQAFELVTGRSPRHHQEELRAGVGDLAAKDPLDEDSDWDEMH
ncbi:MAG: hypothetical protein ABFS21_13100, partial [Actinomycetota bacterium]